MFTKTALSKVLLVLFSSGFFSLSKNYIKRFGICELSSTEKDFLLTCKKPSQTNEFLQRKYRLDEVKPSNADRILHHV